MKAGSGWFFGERMDAPAGGLFDVVGVESRRGADGEYVGADGVEHGADAWKRLAAGLLGDGAGSVRDGVAAGDELGATFFFEFRERVDVVLADPAAAGECECVHSRPPWRYVIEERRCRA